LAESAVEVVRDALTRGQSDRDQSQVRLVEVEDIEILERGEGIASDEADAPSFYGRHDLDLLAARQSVAPAADFEALLGDFWPPDENADSAIAAVRVWRRDAG